MAISEPFRSALYAVAGGSISPFYYSENACLCASANGPENDSLYFTRGASFSVNQASIVNVLFSGMAF